MGLLASSTLLGGCAYYAQAPQPTNFPTQEQQHVQAASHWQLIAGDSARQLMWDANKVSSVLIKFHPNKAASGGVQTVRSGRELARSQ